MDKLSKLWDSVAERFSNPVAGPFLVSWMVINYKVFLVLASEENYLFKFAFLEEVLYGPVTFPIGRLFLYPVLSTLLYLCILPLLGVGATYVAGVFENMQNSARIWVMKRATMSTEQRDRLLADTSDLVAKLDKELNAAKTSRISSAAATKKHIESLFAGLRDPLFEAMKLACPNDTSKPYTKRPLQRHASERPELNQFLFDVGMPTEWLRVFEEFKQDEKLTAAIAAERMNWTKTEAEQRLLQLWAADMLLISWTDDTMCFQLEGSSWGNMLNGRPA